MKKYTIKEWKAEGKKLFGTDDILDFILVCPNCKTSQKGKDLACLGMDKEEVLSYLGFSCIGRFKKEVGCDWTLGGLFRIHEVEIEVEGHTRMMFDFYRYKAIKN